MRVVRLISDAGHDAGHDAVATADDATALVTVVAQHSVDLVIVDVRMPPGMRDDGARAAQQLRVQYPDLAIVLLSQHVETRHVLHLVATGSFGYLLKDRVLRVDDFPDALVRVAAGGTALDPAIVSELVTPSHRDDPIRDLSAREREVLELVAEGKSNTSISRELVIAERTVETHVRAIFRAPNPAPRASDWRDRDESSPVSAGTGRPANAACQYGASRHARHRHAWPETISTMIPFGSDSANVRSSGKSIVTMPSASRRSRRSAAAEALGWYSAMWARGPGPELNDDRLTSMSGWSSLSFSQKCSPRRPESAGSR